jgi:hypothetical protein
MSFDFPFVRLFGVKSRKIKEFKSKAETALWFIESYGLVPQYLKLERLMGRLLHHKIPSQGYYGFQFSGC